MFTVMRNHLNKKSNVFKWLGLTIGFDSTQWFDDGVLLLCYQGEVMASLEGELLESFKSNEYVVENHLVGSF